MHNTAHLGASNDLRATNSAGARATPENNSVRAGMMPNGTFEVSAILIDEAGFDWLIKILQANKFLYHTPEGAAFKAGIDALSAETKEKADS
jgi:hypothetical protein